MYSRIFFDLDTTLAPSRALMKKEHTPLFESLSKTKDVVVVTGGKESQIRAQIPLEPTNNFYMLSQQGNYAVHRDGSLLWHETVSLEQENAVKPLARKITDEFAELKKIKIPNYDDIFENRVSMIASSVLGFHAPNEHKYKVDPDQSIRRELLARHAAELQELAKIGIEAMPAGSTTIDFILKGKNKGFNIERLIGYLSWNKVECLYVGDALFPGGNDESVIGVIDTKAVKNPEETFDFIQHSLLSS